MKLGSGRMTKAISEGELILESKDVDKFQLNIMLEIPGFRKMIRSLKKLVNEGYALEICEDQLNSISNQGKIVLKIECAM
jgi:hypothetical protein